MPAVRVAVVDPLPLFCEGVSSVLSARGHDVARPDDVLLWAEDEPGAPILLTVLSDEHWSLLADLHRTGPERPLIAVLEPLAPATGVRAVRAGARALLSRGEGSRAVSRVVEAAADGHSVLPMPVLALLVEGATGLPAVDRLPEERLMWLRRLAGGATVAQIAGEAGYSERAMYRLLRVLYDQIGVSSRMEAVLVAQQRGWLSATWDPGRPPAR